MNNTEISYILGVLIMIDLRKLLILWLGDLYKIHSIIYCPSICNWITTSNAMLYPVRPRQAFNQTF